MYTNVVQHYNCQSQDNFSTLNITLTEFSTVNEVYMILECKMGGGHGYIGAQGCLNLFSTLYL